MGREDRKDGVHSGNRVLTRIYNHGAIGDLSSAFSGVYPIGSGHAYIFEFSPVIAASVVDLPEPVGPVTKTKPLCISIIS